MVKTIKNNILLGFTLSVLAACGGSGSSSDTNTLDIQEDETSVNVVSDDSIILDEAVIPDEVIIPDEPVIATISSTSFTGVVTYTNYPVSVSTGIDYNNEQLLPVRGVVIQLQDVNGTVLDTGITDTNGGYSLSGDVDDSARIVVRAEISDAFGVNTQVVDNTSSGALYAIFADINVTSDTVIQNLNAPSGWDGTSYSGVRAAGPFSLLDVVYQAQTLVKTVDNDVTFPDLTINWSINNTTANGELTDGDIGTSFYSNNELFILGGENTDTDEYDKAVVAHEWGHYFEDNFSRSDSLGGPHGRLDILNHTVSWSEGFATAIAGMILGSPLYVDTSEAGQSSAFLINAEADSDNDNRFVAPFGNITRVDGYYSEMSVTEIVYDIYDDGSINTGNTDDDNVALGFGPIYNVLTNGVRTTEAFTSLFAFLHYIRIESPDDVNNINVVGNNENIDMANITEFDNPVDTALVPLYTNIAVGQTLTVDSNSNALQTSNIYGGTTSLDTGNKLLNQRFFTATVTDAGCYRVTVTPVSPTAIADVRLVFIERQGVDRFPFSAESIAQNRSAGEVFTFYVDAFIDNAFFNVSLESDPNSCFVS